MEVAAVHRRTDRMLYKRVSSLILALFLVSANIASPVLATTLPQKREDKKDSSSVASRPDLKERLAAIEKAIDEKRDALGIPGLSLVIVKDDKVIYKKGLGFKDAERKLGVTPATLFAIGSCTKAFTAMAAVMSADEGKLSLDDSPKKYLPYFKLQDPEADQNVTIRDLLCHRTGLDNTDIAWYTGVLNREGVIKVAGNAKPTAKFREKFQYQNVMFSAAGEVVARAQNSTWEQIIANRFFKPLGMKASNTSAKQMLKSSDFAIGYKLADKKSEPLALRDLTNIAPAGAINSNANDMGQWLRLMLGGGVFEGKRLVSEKGFNELLTKQISIGGSLSGYALGWGTGEWRGHRLALHSGGIDGFNSLVVLAPDDSLGFVLLTNVTSSPILGAAREIVLSNLITVPEPEASTSGKTPSVDPKTETGKYKFAAAGLNIEIVFRDGNLVAIVPGQPDYPLINVGGRRYKLGAPAPDGFYMTFRPVKEKESETEMYLEQPQGNFVLPKLSADAETDAAPTLATYSGNYEELPGKYQKNNQSIEVKSKEGNLILVVPGQPPYTLVEKEKDQFGAAELPDSYGLNVKRGEDGKITAISLKQPQGEFEFTRMNEPAGESGSLSVEELMARVIEASGGEANIRKHKTMMVTGDLIFENQGLTGHVINMSRAPASIASMMTFIGLGKEIGTVHEHFDGAKGGSETSFSPPEVYGDKLASEARITADFYQPLGWKELFESVTIKQMSKVGDEDVYVVVKKPKEGTPVTDYISAKTFLVLKRDMVKTTGDGAIPVTESYSDYRSVDGVMVPFEIHTSQPGFGSVIAQVKDVKFDVEISDAEFEAKN